MLNNLNWNGYTRSLLTDVIEGIALIDRDIILEAESQMLFRYFSSLKSLRRKTHYVSKIYIINNFIKTLFNQEVNSLRYHFLINALS